MPKVEKTVAPVEQTENKAPKKIAKKKHKGIATFFIVITGIVVLSVGLEMVVTVQSQNMVAKQIDTSLKPERVPDVSISMHPILYKLIIGRVDRIKIDVTGFKLQYGTVVDKATIDLRGLKFDPINMLKTRQAAAIKSMDSGTARIVLSEEAVNTLVSTQLPGGIVKLEKGVFRYIVEMPYVLPGVRIEALGEAIAMPDNILRLKPMAGELEKLDIPQDIKDYLIATMIIDYKLEDVPQGIEITKATIDTGSLTLEADITDLTFLSTGVSGATK